MPVFSAAVDQAVAGPKRLSREANSLRKNLSVQARRKKLSKLPHEIANLAMFSPEVITVEFMMKDLGISKTRANTAQATTGIFLTASRSKIGQSRTFRGGGGGEW